MSVFENYARYYDLLYKDKDYSGETEYVTKLLKKFGNNIQSILEFGCGTGKHAMLLAEKDYTVTGIDASKEMLEKANVRKASRPDLNLKFQSGDIRTVSLDKKFDAIISLFHVISYQNANADLQAVFTNAYRHLETNGIFVFDFWYGPAVLTERPIVKVKRFIDDQIRVTRIAEPELHQNENIVDVNYEVIIEEQKTKQVAIVKEKHRMRYLFLPETQFFLSQCGLILVHAEEWMSSNSPGCNTWGVCCIAKKEEKNG